MSPVLEYSGSVWDPLGVGLQNELEKVQNRAARFLTGNYNFELSSIYVFSYFPFGFEGRIWDLIVSVPDHCLSFYFETGSMTSILEHLKWEYLKKRRRDSRPYIVIQRSEG